MRKVSIKVEEVKEENVSIWDYGKFDKFIEGKLGNKSNEVMGICFVNGNGEVYGYEELTTGFGDSANLKPKDLVKAMVIYEATYIILCHNHVNEDNRFSQGDLEFSGIVFNYLIKKGRVMLNHLLYSGKSNKIEKLFEEEVVRELLYSDEPGNIRDWKLVKGKEVGVNV